MSDIETIYAAVAALADHGISTGLMSERDRIYAINLLTDRLGLSEYEEIPYEGIFEIGADENGCFKGLESILKSLTDYAAAKGLVGNGLEDGSSQVYRDLFDTSLMNCLMPRPSEVTQRFDELYRENPEKATDWYYGISRASDYIRTYRVARDIKWTARTPYGEMIITINLSKPEKDPKAIAAALTMKQSSYPKCQLCAENEGYAGRINHPARHNHRIIPIVINGKSWFLQYSPYVYYNEHCIVFNKEHTPMQINRAAFDKLLDFVRQFPHYTVGSNADLPIVGGSILTHDHFQGGRFAFPMANAGIGKTITLRGFEDITAGIVNWPMTVIRIAGADADRLAECAERILTVWREYSDETRFVYAYSEAQTGHPVVNAPVDYPHHGSEYIPHNTITPIARKRDGQYELDLVLRNNITTQEHPLGVYHPHSEYHHIKKENIGLIEVMGLAILPARLKDELAGVTKALVSGADISSDETLGKHSDWVRDIRSRYPADELADADRADTVVKQEVAAVYSSILEQCAVFGRDEAGREGLMKFIEKI